MRLIASLRGRVLARAEDGFTMLVTIGVLLVGSLLLAGAFAAAEGDISLSHRTTTSKQAYYAALAGIQEYEDKLQIEPNYWEKCEAISGTVGTNAGSYAVKPLPAENPTGGGAPAAACSTERPFETMIERAGIATANTFRVESTGTAGSATKPATRTVVATFKVKGFLNYVYFTNFEDEDPTLYKAPSGCEGKYYEERPTGSYGRPLCSTIEFTSGDVVEGPMHTNDAPDICGNASFGRAGRTIPDAVEFGEKWYSLECNAEPVFNAPGKAPSKAAYLPPPETDTALGRYVLKEYEFTGETHIVLKGTSMDVTNKGTTTLMKLPSNGLIYVRNNPETGCTYDFGEHYEQEAVDTAEEEKLEEDCGTAYVQGSYGASLTIGTEDDLVINGNILPSAISKGGEPLPANDTTTLGLIANNFVRVYHELGEKKCYTYYYGYVQCSYTASTALKNIWIYAGILATKGSFLVDNARIGEPLGYLNVHGAIAQNYRGIVGTGGGYSYTGYLKNYEFDERLAVDEPPYFLSPLNAGWEVVRETSGSSG